MAKKYSSLVSLILFLSFFSYLIPKAYAGPSDNVVGWLWCGSEDADIVAAVGINDNANETGVGWISMNSTNCDADGNGQSDGLGSCPPLGTAMVSYGVNIPAGNGDMSGYGWSENVGWITFNAGELAGCPYGTCSARRSGNSLAGWARVVSIKNEAAVGNSGGWEGWIKLDGVSIDALGNITGYAWSAENIVDPPVVNNFANGFGAIKFAANIKGTEQFLVCPDSATIFVGNTLDLEAKYWNNFFGIADCSSAGFSDVTASASWSSSNSAIAGVDNVGNKGRVSGVDIGSTSISASYNTLNAQSAVSVMNVPCVANCSLTADSHCIGETYTGNCGQSCNNGVKDCGWKEVRP